MGKLFANAVFQMDLPILMAFLMLSTTAIVTANILADLLFAAADPRIRLA
jgi:peptide/nickel transport system permease protein